MSVPGDSSCAISLIRVSRALAAIVLMIPGVVLLGWTLHIEILRRVLPGLVAMNSVTAICFIALGLSLFPLQPENGTRKMRLWG